MKFSVEVVGINDGNDTVLARIEIEERSRRNARTKAQFLLAPWRVRSAASTRRLELRSRSIDRPQNDGAVYLISWTSCRSER